MLSTVKSFKMLPKNNGCDYFHCRQILTAIVNLHCEIRILEYLVSAVIVILFNPCAGPSPRIKIYFSLLSACIDELLSTPK